MYRADLVMPCENGISHMITEEKKTEACLKDFRGGSNVGGMVRARFGYKTKRRPQKINWPRTESRQEEEAE